MTVTTGVPRFYHRPDVRYIPISDRSPVTKSVAVRASDDRPHVLAYVEECVKAVRTSLDLIPTASDVTESAP